MLWFPALLPIYAEMLLEDAVWSSVSFVDEHFRGESSESVYAMFASY